MCYTLYFSLYIKYYYNQSGSFPMTDTGSLFFPSCIYDDIFDDMISTVADKNPEMG